MRSTPLIGLVLGGALGYFNGLGANELDLLLQQDRWGRGCAYGHDLFLVVFALMGASLGFFFTRLAIRKGLGR